jgi:PiT family inorganic phosphate transporter
MDGIPAMSLLTEAPTLTHGIFLVAAVGFALFFEMVNGFHDTANAVATVIYTHSLKPGVAVAWSGLWNLIGVLCSGGMVAFAVVALLPVELVIRACTGAGLAMVFALLISAILWNLGTWYVGLPASSSHSLVGAILGVGMGHAMMKTGHFLGGGVNWAKAADVGASLVISPLLGFCAAALLLKVCKAFVRMPGLYLPPDPRQPPPLWIRGLLMLTCTGVSFAHGSNDGQKGMGLIMLILVGIIPGSYALQLHTREAAIRQLVADGRPALADLERRSGWRAMPEPAAAEELDRFLTYGSSATDATLPALAALGRRLERNLESIHSFRQLPVDRREEVRQDAFLLVDGLDKLGGAGIFTDSELVPLRTWQAGLARVTQFLPFWVKLAVALALSLGTMVGWKRIVVTVGEKIGQSHLTYAQGASAELVAMTTIGAADLFGLPVSTTHVLSSGVAGAMFASHSGLQRDTLRNLLLAWVLTVPVCVFMGAATFAGGTYLLFHLFGIS